MKLIDGDALKKTFCAECSHTIKCEDCDINYHFENLAPEIKIKVETRNGYDPEDITQREIYPEPWDIASRWAGGPYYISKAQRAKAREIFKEFVAKCRDLAENGRK